MNPSKKDFFVYLPTNGRLMKPDVLDRIGDAGIANERFLGGEDAGVVVIEAQDHAAGNVHAGPLNAVHLFEQAAARA